MKVLCVKASPCCLHVPCTCQSLAWWGKVGKETRRQQNEWQKVDEYCKLLVTSTHQALRLLWRWKAHQSTSSGFARDIQHVSCACSTRILPVSKVDPSEWAQCRGRSSLHSLYQVTNCFDVLHVISSFFPWDLRARSEGTLFVQTCIIVEARFQGTRWWIDQQLSE